MKRILLTPILLCSLLFLHGCAGDSKVDYHDTATNTHEETNDANNPQPLVVEDDKDIKDDPKTTEDDGDTDGSATTASCEAIAEPIEPFIWVKRHYGLLRNQAYVISQADTNGDLTLAGETGGFLDLTVTADAPAGATTLKVDSTTALVPNQLITYLSENLDYNVAQIASLDATTITLTGATALVSPVLSGQNLWNFYFDPSHPNELGYKAIADYGYRSVANSITNDGTHVLLGDSWFADGVIRDRLTLRFPDAKIVQSGVGGNTLCDLLGRFETDVSPELPNYVWVNSSVNDYFNDVTQEDYKIRLQNLIFKIQQTGAQAIVYDSAPGPSGTAADGTLLFDLAMRYTSQVENLLNESQP